jgi:hypothetical protein
LASAPLSPGPLPASSSGWAEELLMRFPAAFGRMTSALAATPPHGVRHVIRTVGQPATTKFHRLDPTRLAAAKAEYQAMLDEGVICGSSSQWSGPLHMVRKKDGLRWPCGDYRQFNLQTVEDKCPLPNMADLAARLDGCNIFSKLDLRKGCRSSNLQICNIFRGNKSVSSQHWCRSLLSLSICYAFYMCLVSLVIT